MIDQRPLGRQKAEESMDCAEAACACRHLRDGGGLPWLWQVSQTPSPVSNTATSLLELRLAMDHTRSEACGCGWGGAWQGYGPAAGSARLLTRSGALDGACSTCQQHLGLQTLIMPGTSMQQLRRWSSQATGICTCHTSLGARLTGFKLQSGHLVDPTRPQQHGSTQRLCGGFCSIRPVQIEQAR